MPSRASKSARSQEKECALADSQVWRARDGHAEVSDVSAERTHQKLTGVLLALPDLLDFDAVVGHDTPKLVELTAAAPNSAHHDVGSFAREFSKRHRFHGGRASAGYRGQKYEGERRDRCTKTRKKVPHGPMVAGTWASIHDKTPCLRPHPKGPRTGHLRFVPSANSTARMRFSSLVGSALFLSLAAAGCNTKQIAAGTQAGIVKHGASATETHFDYGLVGQGIPGSIMQLEVVLRTIPDDETVLLALAKAYSSYGYGWVEDEIEQLGGEDFEKEERLWERARWIYLRGRHLAFRVLENEEEDFREQLKKKPEQLKAWLEENFDDEDDAAALFWAGYCWGRAINTAKDDPMMVADLTHARTLIEHSVKLDPTFFNYSGKLFLAVVKANFPEALGGDPKGAKALFEEVLAKTGRSYHLAQLNYARYYAVGQQDRELYHKLLMEIIEAGDVHATRLSNKIARRRAERYLQQADDLF